MPAKELKTILTGGELQIVKAQYDAIAMGKLLSLTLTTQYPPISPYLAAIGKELYPEFKGKPPGPLPAANRERCLVALLASRSRRLELAIHLYLALVNGVDPEELAHILLTPCIYTGVDTIGAAFGVMQGTLEKLNALAKLNTADPTTVLQELAKIFPG